MTKAAAQLAADIEEVPDREAFFAGEHGGDAVALDVLHGGTELSFDFSGAINLGDIGTAENLAAFGLGQESLLQISRPVAKGIQLDCFQRDRLAALGIVGFVDHAGRRFCQFTEDFEMADFRRHSFLAPNTTLNNRSTPTHTKPSRIWTDNR